MELKLEKITPANWKDAAFLTTDASKKYPLDEKWIASNCFSLLQCFYDSNWDCRLLLDGDQAVGFVFYGLDVDSGHYLLCRYMIDFRYQNQGYGKAFLPMVIDQIRSQFACEEIYTSVHDDNARAVGLYRQFGFEPTEEMDAEERFYRLCAKGEKS